MKKRILALALTASALLAGCGESGVKVDPNKSKYTVGICQLVKHNALDAATKGFKDKLTAELGQKGKEVEIVEKVASGDAAECTTIVNGFVASNVDLIMANATAALQAAVNATSTIPVLGTSITEYGVATGLTFTDGKSGTNVSGTSDIASIEEQINIMISLLEDSGKATSKIGILYCSSEANSKFQVDEATKFLIQKGKEVVARSFTDTTDLAAVCASLASSVNAVYIPTDNKCADNTEIIRTNITDAGIPVFTGESGICAGCGFATLSIDYYRLGEVTGKMAAEILTGEKKIEEYPVQYDTNPTKMYNKTIAEQLGITIPSDFEEIVVE